MLRPADVVVVVLTIVITSRTHARLLSGMRTTTLKIGITGMVGRPFCDRLDDIVDSIRQRRRMVVLFFFVDVIVAFVFAVQAGGVDR